MADSNNPGGMTYGQAFWYALEHPFDSTIYAAGDVAFGQPGSDPLQLADNVIAGRLSSDQIQQAGQAAHDAAITAGATEADAQKAASEVTTFINTQEGGSAEKEIATDAAAAGNALKWTGGTILVVAILVLIVLAGKEFREL